MDYLSVFQISGSGMALERLRLEMAAANIAHASTSSPPGASGYVPGRVVATSNFQHQIEHLDASSKSPKEAAAQLMGVGAFEIRPASLQPRLDLDPGHPDANAEGYVAYPDVDPLTEMMTLMSAVRAYEANIRAAEASRSMLLKALEIGGRS